MGTQNWLAAATITLSFIISALPMSLTAKEVTLPKGHVVDFLLLSRKDNIDGLRKQYFSDLYPPAKALGYQPVTGFGVSQKPISGYYHPDVIAIGIWPGDWSKRQSLFKELSEVEPDIRSRRLDIWSSFNMLNAELKEDVTIGFSPDKTYVFGAFWFNDTDLESSSTALIKQISQSGGEVEFFSDSAKSMFGYANAPDVILISQWDSPQAFAAYSDQQRDASTSNIHKANEYFLDVKS